MKTKNRLHVLSFAYSQFWFVILTSFFRSTSSQGFKSLNNPQSDIGFSNLQILRKPSNSNYDMSIKNCQVIHKSFIVRMSYALNRWLKVKHDS